VHDDHAGLLAGVVERGGERFARGLVDGVALVGAVQPDPADGAFVAHLDGAHRSSGSIASVPVSRWAGYSRPNGTRGAKGWGCTDALLAVIRDLKRAGGAAGSRRRRAGRGRCGAAAG